MTEMGGGNSAEELFLITVTDGVLRYTVMYLHTCEPSVLGVSECSNSLSQFWFLDNSLTSSSWNVINSDLVGDEFGNIPLDSNVPS